MASESKLLPSGPATSKVGGLDLVAAAVATDAAVDLAKNLIAEVMPDFKPYSLKTVLGEFCSLLFQRIDGHHLCPEPLHLGPDECGSIDRPYERKVMTFWTAYIMLDEFLTSMQAFPSRGRQYNPSLDRTKLSNLEKCVEDDILLSEIFS